MAVTKISSCWVNISQMKVGNQAARVFFFFLVLFFIYLPMEVAGDQVHRRQRKSSTPSPQLKDNPASWLYSGTHPMITSVIRLRLFFGTAKWPCKHFLVKNPP